MNGFKILSILYCSPLIALFLLPFPSAAMAAITGDYQTRSGKSLLIEERHPVGQSLSDIYVKSIGFEHNLSEVFKDQDPIREVHVADLDNNGFDEFYIITASSGSGSYGNVIAFASNRDKSLSMIYFPEFQQEDARFAGYMGHDTFTTSDTKLLRSFPIYQPSDTNNKPTGGTRRIAYGLFAGEAGWQLRITDTADDDLPAGGAEPWSEAVFEHVNQTFGPEAEERLRYLHDLVDDNLHLSVEEKLKVVNETLNHVPWIADSEHWQEADYWATPMQTVTTFGGDCEDIAIAKWLVLEHLGISADHLRLAYAKIKTTGEDHMVLLYIINPADPPEKQNAYVLDNYIDQVKLDDQRNDLLAVLYFDVQGNIVLIEDNGTERNIKGVYEERKIRKLDDLLERIDEEDRIYTELNGGRSLLPSV